MRRLRSRKDLHARSTRNRKRLFYPPAFLKLASASQRDTARYALLSQKPHVIGTRECKARFRRDLERFVASFILDIAWQRVYERSC